MMSPQLRAEEIANEFGVSIEHAAGCLWVTTDSVPADVATALSDRLRKAGYAVRHISPDDLVPGNVDLIVDMTTLTLEYRQELGSQPDGAQL